MENRTEKAILDFFIINEKMRPFLRRMRIYENNEFNFFNLAQCKKNSRITETDHNGLVIDMELKAGKCRSDRSEIFYLPKQSLSGCFL